MTNCVVTSQCKKYEHWTNPFLNAAIHVANSTIKLKENLLDLSADGMLQFGYLLV